MKKLLLSFALAFVLMMNPAGIAFASNDVTVERTVTVGVANPSAASQERAGIQLGRLMGTTHWIWCGDNKDFPGYWSTTTEYGFTAVQVSNCSNTDVCIEVTITSGSNVNAAVYQSDPSAADPYDPPYAGKGPGDISTNYLSDGATTGTTIFNAMVKPGIFEVVFFNVTGVEQSSVTFYINPNYSSDDNKIYYECPPPVPLSNWGIIFGVLAIAVFIIFGLKKFVF